MSLTKRQAQVFGQIASFIENSGYSPSMKEIGFALGISSLATVHKHLTNLERKGYIKRDYNCSRSITVLTDKVCPSCGCAI